MGKAIFAFTGTREIPEEEVELELARWLPTLKRALSDPLGALIGEYDKAVRANGNSTVANLEELVLDLRAAARLRNVICHGSWRTPDEREYSTPFFVSRDGDIFDTPIDVAWLRQLRHHVVELIAATISSVTHMGWQFPGSRGPGKPVWPPVDQPSASTTLNSASTAAAR